MSCPHKFRQTWDNRLKHSKETAQETKRWTVYIQWDSKFRQPILAEIIDRLCSPPRWSSTNNWSASTGVQTFLSVQLVGFSLSDSQQSASSENSVAFLLFFFFLPLPLRYFESVFRLWASDQYDSRARIIPRFDSRELKLPRKTLGNWLLTGEEVGRGSGQQYYLIIVSGDCPGQVSFDRRKETPSVLNNESPYFWVTDLAFPQNIVN